MTTQPPRKRRTVLCAVCIGLLLCSVGSVWAQGQKPDLQAVRLTVAPELDGDILEDPAWAEAPIASGFTQTRPDAGQAASERTEIRLGFTDKTLYVGVVLYDDAPEGLVVTDSRRDASLATTDSIQFIIDSYRDSQNGYVFGTNPAGIEYDGQLVNESSGTTRGGRSFAGGGGGGGFGGRFRRGTGSGFNLNWDGSWQVATEIGSYGWSAEFAIPFATLRYPASRDPQTWGLNFERVIERNNEDAFWAALEQQYGLYRLADAGTLSGIVAPRPRNLKLIPYAKATARRPPTGPRRTEDDSEVGIDIKYSITPSLTLDATYNTDFAQVEVDEQQVNLDRFNLFFPEKRPFFLENAGLFAVGAGSEAELFFSRRIGISASGDPIPIEGGARISGKVGRTNVGIIGMLTESLVTSEEAFAADSFGVVRVNRELKNRSNVGVLFVNREGSGSFSTPNDENQTFGIDGKIGIGDYHDIKGWYSQTDTPGIERDDHAYEVGWRMGTPLWSADVGYLEVGDGFNPEVGFLSRKNFKKPSGRIQRRIRPKDFWGLLEVRPHVSYSGHWNLNGFQESEFIHIDNAWEWRNGIGASTGVNLTYEGVKEPFEISPDIFVQPGEYDHEEAFAFVSTDQGKPVSVFVRGSVGGFFGGERTSISNTVQLRRSEVLTSQISWQYDNVNLPVGDFDVNLGRLRLSYSPRTNVLVQLLTQYNDRSNEVATNLRFSWLRDANTGLFIVYNEIDEFGSNPVTARTDRSLIIKYSQLIDVFR
ncbi:MAG: DUF5916 domain-containing protein [Acidobacteriota bacterium]|nr:DUF5916 domain-containing protein [Acidobacteriota bacterium]